MPDKGISNSRKYVAELLGTMALVFVGVGSATLAGGRIGYVGVSFAFGGVLAVMAYVFGPISGCHVNPAVTISMLSVKKITGRDAAAYIVMQCIGAIIAAGLLLAILSGRPLFDVAGDGIGTNGYADASLGGYSMLSCFIAEVLLTFFFIFVIFGTVGRMKNPAAEGVAMGIALFLVHVLGIHVTGTSVNPARSLGPAVFAGGVALQQLWLFWLAPIFGGLLAAAAWLHLLKPVDGQG